MGITPIWEILNKKVGSFSASDRKINTIYNSMRQIKFVSLKNNHKFTTHPITYKAAFLFSCIFLYSPFLNGTYIKYHKLH